VTVELARGSLRSDGRRLAIYPADVRGRFARARQLVFWVLIAVYVALPWIPVGGHPAVFLDIEARRFFVFGATFNAQDVWMMVVLLLGVGLGLIVATALLGRVWCGWACPQTVFLEAIYRRVERWLLGSRDQRLRRAAAGWTVDRAWRTAIVHTLWIAISLALAHVFLSYFVSIPRLHDMMRGSPGAHPEAFALVMAVSGALYFNFAWFREQLCVVLCPYGRLQSVLLDQESLIVGYDARRGEPRGKATQADKGDCVDCKRCVTVCPTGIDIREGLQMDCIACTACIDACDDIMDRLGRARGLIRYDSQAGLRGEPSRVLRPRILAYSAVLLVGGIAAALALGARRDFEANLLRAVGAPFTLEDGTVRNSLHVHLVNKRADGATFTLAAADQGDVTVTLPVPRVALDSLAGRDVPVLVTVPRARYRPGMEVTLSVVPEGEGEPRVLRARILGPVSAVGPGTGARR
jgi:cytochrome c oxidase accessory protein FixG